MSDGLDRLINPWTLTVTVNDGQRDQHFPPLVDMLRARVVPDGNQNGGGSAVNTRNVIDVKSLDLLTHIKDVTHAWLELWGVRMAGELKLDLRGYWDKLTSLHKSGAMDEDTHGHLASYPDTWAEKIWDLIETPLRVPIRGLKCPRCGVDKVINADGEASDNLIVLWRDGQEPTAECQVRECAAIWVSESGLEALGIESGLEIDIVALREARLARHAE